MKSSSLSSSPVTPEPGVGGSPAPKTLECFPPPVAAFLSFARATPKVTKKAALFLFSVVVLLAGGAAAARGQSALDGFNPDANGQVFVVVVQPDGKILMGGRFTTVLGVPRNHIARLNSDGTLDTVFNPIVNDGSYVGAIAVQPDGQILICGDFSNVNLQPRNYIARLDRVTGMPEPYSTFSHNAVGGLSIAVQADGKILVGGRIGNNWFIRLNSDGTEDSTFNPGVHNDVRAIAVQADGKILIGGDFDSIGGDSTRKYLARLNGNGTVDPTFINPSANDEVHAIAVQADGKILAGGFFTSIGNQPRNYIARLKTNGTPDTTFDPNTNGDSDVRSIAVQADGKILVGGDFFTNIGGQPRHCIARLNQDGTADSFNPNPNPNELLIRVLSIAVQADGKILAGGSFTTLAPNGGPAVTRNNIARLETDGRLDQTLNLNTVGDAVYATAVQPDGKILFGGSFTTVLGVPRNNIARLNTDGTLDTAFDPSANNIVYAIAVQPDGRILVGGSFSLVAGVQGNIVRLNENGTPDTSFSHSGGGNIYAIALQADGRILAGGGVNGLERLNPNGTLDTTFSPNANNNVRSIALQADGKILVGGEFTSIGGQPRNYIARLGTNGAADLTFNPNAGAPVQAIAVQAEDNKILVGGFFASIGGQTRASMVRLNADGTLDADFNPNVALAGFAQPVLTIAVQTDRKILVGGFFGGIGGQARSCIARLEPTTGLADSFDPSANNIVYAIALQKDGKILVGGGFTAIGGQPRNLFARLTNDIAALQNLIAVSQTGIAWGRSGSSPQVTRVTFEYSTDNVSYAFLGNGTVAGSRWDLEGLSLPTNQNFYIRARGYYRTGYGDGSESITESVRNAFISVPSNLGNISTRLRVGTSDNVLIGGFIVTGTQPKKVILRAIGPSLPVAGALADPILELRDSSGGLIRSNDNWRIGGQEAEIIATGVPPSNDLESAIVATLPANGSAYTAVVSGANNGTGIGLVEAYDLDRTVDSKLANISTRGFVQTGDDVLIGGLIVLGQDPLRVIVRAIGPSLPVSGALGDPTLELRDNNGALIASNDNWRSDQEAEIIATTIPPSSDLESAIVRNLAPAAYTAIVRGVNNATGVALVEVFALN